MLIVRIRITSRSSCCMNSAGWTPPTKSASRVMKWRGPRLAPSQLVSGPFQRAFHGKVPRSTQGLQEENGVERHNPPLLEVSARACRARASTESRPQPLIFPNPLHRPRPGKPVSEAVVGRLHTIGADTSDQPPTVDRLDHPMANREKPPSQRREWVSRVFEDPSLFIPECRGTASGALLDIRWSGRISPAPKFTPRDRGVGRRQAICQRHSTSTVTDSDHAHRSHAVAVRTKSSRTALRARFMLLPPPELTADIPGNADEYLQLCESLCWPAAFLPSKFQTYQPPSIRRGELSRSPRLKRRSPSRIIVSPAFKPMPTTSCLTSGHAFLISQRASEAAHQPAGSRVRASAVVLERLPIDRPGGPLPTGLCSGAAPTAGDDLAEGLLLAASPPHPLRQPCFGQHARNRGRFHPFTLPTEFRAAHVLLD